MAILEVHGDCALVKLRIRPDEIDDLLTKHRKHYPHAEDCEALGSLAIDSGFSWSAVRKFIIAVCEWGRGHRLVRRILDNNTPRSIAAALREGHKMAIAGGADAGVERISALQHLGQSFASKLLRFLVPERAVILDDVLRTRLGYAETRAGYEEFLTDCMAILETVQKSAAVPRKTRSAWRVCDIETALFAKIQGY